MLPYLFNLLCISAARRYPLQLAESVIRDDYVYWDDLEALDGRSVYESRYQHSPTLPQGYGRVFCRFTEDILSPMLPMRKTIHGIPGLQTGSFK
jgi:hypothetical protein